MVLVLVLVFFSVFVVAALLLIASGTGASQQTKQALTVLQAALATDKAEYARSDRRCPQRRTAQRHPMDQSLAVEDRSGATFAQSDLSGESEMDYGPITSDRSPALFTTYLIYLRTGAIIFAVLIGILLGGGPLPTCFISASSASTNLNRNCRKRWT